MKIKPFSIPLVRVWINDKQIEHYRELVRQVSPNEVQWYSEVFEEFHEKDGKQYIDYILEGMHVPEQVVTAVETDTEADPMALYNILKSLEEKHGEEEANEIIKRMHCWCHSHPFDANKPNPSSTDDKTFASWATSNNAQNVEVSTVALIFGKDGTNIHGRVYNPKYPNIIFDDVEVKIYREEPEDLAYITDLVASRIKKKTVNNGYNGQWTVREGRYSFSPTEQKTSNTVALTAAPTTSTQISLLPKTSSKADMLNKFNLQNTNKYFAKHLGNEWSESLSPDELSNLLWKFLQQIMSFEELTLFCELITEQGDSVINAIEKDNLSYFAKRPSTLDTLLTLFETYMNYEYAKNDHERCIVYLRSMIYFAKSALTWTNAEQKAGWQILLTKQNSINYSHLNSILGESVISDWNHSDKW